MTSINLTLINILTRYFKRERINLIPIYNKRKLPFKHRIYHHQVSLRIILQIFSVIPRDLRLAHPCCYLKHMHRMRLLVKRRHFGPSNINVFRDHVDYQFAVRQTDVVLVGSVHSEFENGR